jgi:hypothetical protein
MEERPCQPAIPGGPLNSHRELGPFNNLYLSLSPHPMQTTSLPVEILTIIVHFALDNSTDDHHGKIGQGAAWRMPNIKALDRILNRESKLCAPNTTEPYFFSGLDIRIGEIRNPGMYLMSTDEIKKEASEAPITFYTVATTLQLYVIVIL